MSGAPSFGFGLADPAPKGGGRPLFADKCELKKEPPFGQFLQLRFSRFLVEISRDWPILGGILRPIRANSLIKSRWQKKRRNLIILEPFWSQF